MNVALLGFELKTYVLDGENARKTLSDNFVVLGFKQYPYLGKNQVVDYPQAQAQANKYGMAIWLSEENALSPIHTVGGFLPADWSI